ncbi:MAG: anhydro-N-acetylmuramic acid kinase [Bacteroidetes bacterium]|nr:anhydro-N-acetylmuramic acid kinase [Bacteroidota bacterium]
MIRYNVIGIMSGTSLDGLDIAYCEFVRKEKENKWKHKIIYAETIKYDKRWREKLSKAFKQKKNDPTAIGLKQLDKEYGKYIGNEILRFIRRKKISPHFIASHGHTVFHQPEKKFTLQIGDGETIASVCKLPVVCNFRSGDIALGGQGAPLVPMADKLLFSEYDFCLNLGGITNVSFTLPRPHTLTPLPKERGEGSRVAFDICPVNIVLNGLANKLGKEFDKGGKLASKGTINNTLLKKLNLLSFYKTKPPKSLGREWVEKKFMPVLNTFNISVQDKLRTTVEHIALQISTSINSKLQTPNPKLIITGGGAYNDFLIKRISFHAQCKTILPDDKTIQFKEAMAFAFLGVLKMRGEINILKSVTGAKRNSSGGKIYFANQNAGSSPKN